MISGLGKDPVQTIKVRLANANRVLGRDPANADARRLRAAIEEDRELLRHRHEHVDMIARQHAAHDFHAIFSADLPDDLADPLPHQGGANRQAMETLPQRKHPVRMNRKTAY